MPVGCLGDVLSFGLSDANVERAKDAFSVFPFCKLSLKDCPKISLC